MIEVLLFAIDDIADNKIPLEPAICYEFDYQSAIAVKEYAAGLGMSEAQLPWYREPQNDVEKLLLTGPVLSDSNLEHVFEKRRHLDTWK